MKEHTEIKTENINLVDERGKRIGTIEKQAAHEAGLLHEAFSVLIFSDLRGDILLQKRASGKYHSGGLWSNACCGHTREDEDLETAVHRRLKEEMGFDCELSEVEHPPSPFYYRFVLSNGLIEHELDHVFIGISDKPPMPDEDEVDDYKYMRIHDLLCDMRDHPELYTPWFIFIVRKMFPRLS